MINSRPRYPKVSGRIPRVDLGINVNVANTAICYDKLALNRNVQNKLLISDEKTAIKLRLN